MKNLFPKVSSMIGLVLGTLAFGATAAHATDVSQGLKVTYYSENVARRHVGEIFESFDNELRNYDCLSGETDAGITKKVKSRIFSADTPGELYLTYKTRCHGADLASVRFAIDSIGYDEDYTVVLLQVKLRSGRTVSKQTCYYGLDRPAGRRCPSEVEAPVNFSQAAE